jgi:N-acetylglucosaminyl-diphospho-decaprenol L-rhamnosyltransferase
MDILIIILNYRTPDLTVQCLESLGPELGAGNRVIVVDNFSEDGSPEKIGKAIQESGWGGWASVMPLPHNKGYAAGNNAAIREALAWPEPPRYIHILNPDTIILKGAIKALIDFMDSHPQAGIAGSYLQCLDGTPQSSAFRFPNIINELDHGLRLGIVHKRLTKWYIVLDFSDKPQLADWVCGASFIVRTEVFKTCGLLDEGFFLYFEEVDFCLHVKRAGWECWSVPESKVIHLVGQSTEVNRINEPPKRRPKYWFDSRRRYFQKNHGLFYAIIIDLVWMVSFALWRIRRVLQQKPDPDPPHMLWDFFKNSSLFHHISS